MILQWWEKLSKIPFGRTLFNWAIRFYVPYTGSVRPQVIELKKGYCKLQMHDRRCLRNHLNSIHAAALMNIAEAASGMAFIVSLPPKTKAIVTEFKVEYKKKARGTLTSECHCEVPSSNTEQRIEVEGIVRDSDNDVVAIGRATWFVRPIS